MKLGKAERERQEGNEPSVGTLTPKMLSWSDEYTNISPAGTSWCLTGTPCPWLPSLALSLGPLPLHLHSKDQSRTAMGLCQKW